jgi:hypothetical protein
MIADLQLKAARYKKHAQDANRTSGKTHSKHSKASIQGIVNDGVGDLIKHTAKKFAMVSEPFIEPSIFAHDLAPLPSEEKARWASAEARDNLVFHELYDSLPENL